MEILEYIDRSGRSPFADWFEGLNSGAAARITVALTRMAQGNFSGAKGIASGVYEFRIDSGPGYRVYFGKDGKRIVILLAGGTKRRQQRDIEDALSRWDDFKQRKKGKT